MWFYCYIELCNQNLTGEQCTYKLYRTYIYTTFSILLTDMIDYVISPINSSQYFIIDLSYLFSCLCVES